MAKRVLIRWVADPPSFDVVKIQDIVLEKNKVPEVDTVYDVRYGENSERASAKILFIGTLVQWQILTCIVLLQNSCHALPVGV